MMEEIMALSETPEIDTAVCDDQKILLFHLKFPTGVSELTTTQAKFLDQNFKTHLGLMAGNSKRVKQIRFFGHADLQWFRTRNIESNLSLANERAEVVRNRALQTITNNPQDFPPNILPLVQKSTALSHFHPFLAQCDALVSCDLREDLGYGALLNSIKDDLNIDPYNLSKDYNDRKREDPVIRSKISQQIEAYRRIFYLFRSVVVIIDFS